MDLKNYEINLDKTFGDSDNHVFKFSNVQLDKLQTLSVMMLRASQDFIDSTKEKFNKFITEDRMVAMLTSHLSKENIEELKTRVFKSAAGDVIQKTENHMEVIRSILTTIGRDTLDNIPTSQLLDYSLNGNKPVDKTTDKPAHRLELAGLDTSDLFSLLGLLGRLKSDVDDTDDADCQDDLPFGKEDDQ